MMKEHAQAPSMTRVLVVDDEKSIRTSVQAFLRDAGYEVEIAVDAQSARELLAGGDYDVVVSDIILPGASGVTLLKAIRDASPDVQVIMMTGEPNVETASGREPELPREPRADGREADGRAASGS